VTPQSSSRSRFYRGNHDNGQEGGAGLGLSIALQIVRSHGGHITIANRSPRGCSVSVTLPELQPTVESR
jgi:signal transduction histidine kinase